MEAHDYPEGFEFIEGINAEIEPEVNEPENEPEPEVRPADHHASNGFCTWWYKL